MTCNILVDGGVFPPIGELLSQYRHTQINKNTTTLAYLNSIQDMLLQLIYADKIYFKDTNTYVDLDIKQQQFIESHILLHSITNDLSNIEELLQLYGMNLDTQLCCVGRKDA